MSMPDSPTTTSGSLTPMPLPKLKPFKVKTAVTSFNALTRDMSMESASTALDSFDDSNLNVKESAGSLVRDASMASLCYGASADGGSSQVGSPVAERSLTGTNCSIDDVFTPIPGRHITPFKRSVRMLLPSPNGVLQESDLESPCRTGLELLSPASNLTTPGPANSSPIPQIKKLSEMEATRGIAIGNPSQLPDSAYGSLKKLNHIDSPGLPFADFISIFILCSGCDKVFTKKSFYIHHCASQIIKAPGTPLGSAHIEGRIKEDIKQALIKIDATSSKDLFVTSFEENMMLLDRINAGSPMGGVTVPDFTRLFVECRACHQVMTKRAWLYAHKQKKCYKITLPWEEHLLNAY